MHGHCCLKNEGISAFFGAKCKVMLARLVFVAVRLIKNFYAATPPSMLDNILLISI
jgi:hypothetical protein